MKNSVVIFFLFMISVSLYAGKDMLLGKMQNVRTIQLEKPMLLSGIIDIEGNLCALDRKTNALVLVSQDGKILWNYQKSGKGPGEYSQAVRVSAFYNNILYVVDNMLSKVMLFTYTSKTKTLTYFDEFLFNEGRTASVFITESGRILMPVSLGKHQLIEVNAQGAVVARFIPSKEFTANQNTPPEDIIKAIQDSSFGLAGNDTYLLRANILSNTLQFMKKDGDNYKELKKTTIQRISKDTFDKVSSNDGQQQRIQIRANGVLTHHFMGNLFYVMGSTPDNFKESAVEVYSVDGVYKGYYLLEDVENEKVGLISFRKDGTFIFQKQTSDKGDTMVTDDTRVYIGKFVK